MPAVVGARIGPYEILAAIGAGGMGEVYRARDSRLERDVALKVLPAAAVGDETARARLVREARLASKLNHPHICTIYEVGETDGQTHIAMELVEGQTLAARLRGGALPVEQVLRVGQQLAGALAHAHARGVVHRDFKSANVVVTPDGHVKVLDFGLAKRLAGDATADETTMSRQSLTEAGMVAGTLAYMAPEQLRGQPADARSDIWALGVVLYELVAGERPFRGNTAFELSSAILNQPVPTVPPSVPAPLTSVVERCLAKEPGERYQRADDVRAALEVAASGQAVAAAVPVRRGRRLSRRLVRAAGGIVLLAGAAAAIFSLDVASLRSRLARAAVPPARAITLAVLPFENASGKADQDPFSDAQTQEINAALGQLRPEALLVKARGSVMRYKKTDKSRAQIGRELGVEYLLEGTAQVVGAQVHLWAELVRVADETQVWGKSYVRDMAGILVLQNDVAQQVAKELAIKLLPAEEARLAGAKTVDPDAYALRVKGDYLLARFTKADIDAAEQHFQRALAKDPSYGRAYLGSAYVWAFRRQMGLVPAREAGPKIRAAIQKAIELGDTVEGSVGIARLLWLTDLKVDEAEREYRHALDLDPNNAEARADYSHVLMNLGRTDEGMRQIELALALDPLNDFVRVFHVGSLVFARRYDEALARGKEFLRAQPGSLACLGLFGSAAIMKQQWADAVAANAAMYEGLGRPDVAEAMKKGYAEAGYAAAFRRAADVELEKHGNEGGVEYDAAGNYAIAGDYPRALDWLEKAYDNRDPGMPYLGCTPFFDPLRADPRFKALLRKMGLPQ